MYMHTNCQPMWQFSLTNAKMLHNIINIKPNKCTCFGSICKYIQCWLTSCCLHKTSRYYKEGMDILQFCPIILKRKHPLQIWHTSIFYYKLTIQQASTRWKKDNSIYLGIYKLKYKIIPYHRFMICNQGIKWTIVLFSVHVKLKWPCILKFIYIQNKQIQKVVFWKVCIFQNIIYHTYVYSHVQNVSYPIIIE